MIDFQFDGVVDYFTLGLQTCVQQASAGRVLRGVGVTFPTDSSGELPSARVEFVSLIVPAVVAQHLAGEA